MPTLLGDADFAGGDRRSFSPHRCQVRSRSRERSHNRSREYDRDRQSRDRNSRDRFSSRYPIEDRRRSPDFGRDQVRFNKITVQTCKCCSCVCNFVIFFLVGNGLRLTKYSTNFRVISPLQQTFNQSFLCLLRDSLRMISSTQY